MLAGLKCLHGHPHMDVVWGGDVDGVGAAFGERLRVVVVDLGDAEPCRQVLGLADGGREDGDNLGVLRFGEGCRGARLHDVAGAGD